MCACSIVASDCVENTATLSCFNVEWSRRCHAEAFVVPLPSNVPWLSANMPQYAACENERTDLYELSNKHMNQFKSHRYVHTSQVDTQLQYTSYVRNCCESATACYGSGTQTIHEPINVSFSIKWQISVATLVMKITVAHFITFARQTETATTTTKTKPTNMYSLKKETMLVCLGLVYIAFSVFFFNIMNSVVVNQHRFFLPSCLFHAHTASSSHVIWGFSNFALCTNQNMAVTWRDKTLNVHLHSYLLRCYLSAQARGSSGE
jgi:hypothetical protein